MRRPGQPGPASFGDASHPERPMRSLLTIFKIPELRMKILFTLGLLAIYRLGFLIPLPYLDQTAVKEWMQAQQGDNWQQMLSQMSMLSGSNLNTLTIFGLGIMPYISASIIFQLLASTVPYLEKMQKEGEVGRKKINELTRYAAVLICLVQSAVMMSSWMQQSADVGANKPAYIAAQYQTFWHGFVAVMVMTAGTMFLMWIGEQIDEYGIGNGISLIIMAGIIGRLPDALDSIRTKFQPSLTPEAGNYGILFVVGLLALLVAVIVGVVFMTQAQRRVPLESARFARGRRAYGGGRQYLPLRLNQSGVMPIIFASSLLLIPGVILSQLAKTTSWEWLIALDNSFHRDGFLYLLGYIVLIFFFCYFWTAIQFNPKDISNNLKDYGSFVHGIRPGKRTADFLEKLVKRITYVGAAFLCLVALFPTIMAGWMDLDPRVSAFFGGTSLLILISVALDLIQKIDSHLIMRNYPSLLDPK
jgi:preprotein translocase subunit SecY